MQAQQIMYQGEGEGGGGVTIKTETHKSPFSLTLHPNAQGQLFAFHFLLLTAKDINKQGYV